MVVLASKRNCEYEYEYEYDASIINSNITNTLHHIDQANSTLKNGDTEAAQNHLDLARQNLVSGVCQIWQSLNNEFLPIGPRSTPISNLSKAERR